MRRRQNRDHRPWAIGAKTLAAKDGLLGGLHPMTGARNFCRQDHSANDDDPQLRLEVNDRNHLALLVVQLPPFFNAVL